MKSLQMHSVGAVAVLVLFGFTASTMRGATFVSGGASGTWTSNGSPYIVQSNVSITNDLTITEGVEVRVLPDVTFAVQQNVALYALGTSNSPVIFTSDRTNPAPGDWVGITAVGANQGNPPIVLSNCVIQYAVQGINAHAVGYFGHSVGLGVAIQNSTIRFCSGDGIWLWAGWSGIRSGTLWPRIQYNNVYSNLASGMMFVGNDNYYGTVENNTIWGNGTWGIDSLVTGQAPSVVNNTICGNKAGGIYFEQRSVAYQTAPVENNLVTGNGVGIRGNWTDGLPNVSYNDVWGNGTNWMGAATNYVGISGNISIDPLYENPDMGDFHLRSQVGRYDSATATWVWDAVTSPCIDAGDPGSSFANEPEPNGGRINMGADGGTAFAGRSLPRLTAVLDTATRDFVLSWGCMPGETYRVLYSGTVAGPWLDDLPSSQITAGSSQTTLAYTNASFGAQTNRFYRVRWNTP